MNLELKGQRKPFLKIYANYPKAVPVLAKEIQCWGIECFEKDILFIHRYLRDIGITPMSEIEVEGEYVPEDGHNNQNSSKPKQIPLFLADSIAQQKLEPRKDWKILALDIETYSRHREIDFQKNPILMVALYGRDLITGAIFEKVFTWKPFAAADKTIEFASTEKELLQKVIDYIQQYSPEVLTGYFSDGFDLPYIQARCQINKLAFNIGLDGSGLLVRKSAGNRMQEVKITGIIHLDMLKFIKQIFGLDLKVESYSLDTIAEKLLGHKKHVVNLDQLSAVWDSHPRQLEQLEQFCLYNLQDARLTFLLCEKLLPEMMEFSVITGLPLFDVTRMRFGRLVESYILKKAISRKIIAPNRPGDNEMEDRLNESIQGGFVYEPKPGLYKDLAVFDFRSLYPSIIVSHNIGPESLQCSCCGDNDALSDKVPGDKALDNKVPSNKALDNKAPNNKAPNNRALDNKVSSNKAPDNKVQGNNVSGNKLSSNKVPGREQYWFCKNKQAFLPSLLEELINRRIEVKKQIKQIKQIKMAAHKLDSGTETAVLQAKSYALKILANSFYGYLGFYGARWYSIESAASTTAYARYYIQDTINKAKRQGFDVCYSDTDSCFLLLGEKSVQEALAFMDSVNKLLPENMELQFEGCFPRGIFVAMKGQEARGAKKKYALLKEDGSVKITGFETVRRNWSLLAKEAQQAVLKLVLQDQPETALSYVKSIVKDFKKGLVPIEKLVIKTQITRDLSRYKAIGPHIYVARRMMAQGERIGPGTLIKYVITKGSGLVRERARLPAEVKEGDYDYNYYINHQLIPAVSSIFSVLGYSEEDIFKESSQKGLGGFM